jgi:hypothetical protein
MTPLRLLLVSLKLNKLKNKLLNSKAQHQKMVTKLLEKQLQLQKMLQLNKRKKLQQKRKYLQKRRELPK